MPLICMICGKPYSFGSFHTCGDPGGKSMQGPYWQTFENETVAHVFVFDRKIDRVTRFCDGDGIDDPNSLKSVSFHNPDISNCQVCTRFLAALRA